MADLRMPDLNTVIIAGRIVRDPELRYSGGGVAFCRLDIANTRYYRKKDGEKGEEVCFIAATCFDKQAEFVGERLKKGRPVIVEGRLATDQWEDKSTGKKQSRTNIKAQRITPLDWDDDGGADQQSNSGQARASERTPAEDDLPF